MATTIARASLRSFVQRKTISNWRCPATTANAYKDSADFLCHCTVRSSKLGMFMSTEFKIGNLLPRFCRLAFNRILLAQITNGLLGSCAVTAVFLGSFVVTLSATAGTLDDVRSRGKLICGVSEGLPGFSEKDNSGVWRGFDVDFCKAVAAAALGDAARVEYLSLPADARFGALRDRRIDLLSRNSTWTMSRDLELGLEFAGITYFDGQGFLVPALFGATSPLQLGGAKICVATGTTSE